MHMSIEENKRLVRRYQEIYNSNHLLTQFGAVLKIKIALSIKLTEREV